MATATLEQLQRDLALIAFRECHGDSSGGAVWCEDRVQAETPEEPAVAGAIPIVSGVSQRRALDGLAAPQGGYMRRSSWSSHWHSIRASAGMPDQDFYELKHRAIQWMVDPVEDGGLGLDPATAAAMVGHEDGGS